MKGAATRFPAHFAGLLLLVTATALPAATVAQSPDETGTIIGEMIDCADIEDDDRRLDCFDRNVGPLAEDDGTEVSADAEQVFVGADGSWTSDIVSLDRAWHISWQSTAVQMTVEIRNAENHIVAVAATQIGEGSGQSSEFDPGDYRLSVRAVDGEWRLNLIEE